MDCCFFFSFSKKSAACGRIFPTSSWNKFGGIRPSVLGRLAYNGEKMKVKILMGAVSYPRPLVKRSSEQFLFSL